MTQPELSFSPQGTIENAILRCKDNDWRDYAVLGSNRAWDCFRCYHLERTWIFTAFRRFTHEAIDSGRKHFSSMGVVDRIRWESMIRLGNENEYKISNTSHPFYARTFMEFEPKHQGFFRTQSKPLTGLISATKIKDGE